MKIAFLIEDNNITNGGARPLINWARYFRNSALLISISPKLNISDENFVSVKTILELTQFLRGYDILIVSDNSLKIGVKIKSRLKIELAVYVQITFGMHALGVNTGMENKVRKIAYTILRIIPFRFIAYEYSKRLKTADYVLANSKTMESLLNFVYGIQPTTVLAPPVDTELFSLDQDAHKNCILIFTGREGDNNDYGLIPYIVETSERYSMKIEIFGENPIPKDANIDMSGIKMNGKLTDQELVALYNRSAVTICIQKQEYFGYVPVESLSCGTPVITLYPHDAENFDVCEKPRCIRRSGLNTITSDLIDSILCSSEINARQKCRQIALNYSIAVNSKSLINAFQRNRKRSY